jgi:hypothetical protein
VAIRTRFRALTNRCAILFVKSYMVIRRMLHPGGGGDSPKMFELDSNKCDFRIRGGVDTWLADSSGETRHTFKITSTDLVCSVKWQSVWVVVGGCMHDSWIRAVLCMPHHIICNCNIHRSLVGTCKVNACSMMACGHAHTIKI